MKKKAAFALFIILLSAVPGICQQKETEKAPVNLTAAQTERVAAHPTVRVGVFPGFPPFLYVEDGVWKGTHIDYLNLIAERTGLRFERVSMHPSGWEARARAGDIDMFPSFDIPERRARMNMTQPFMEYKLVIITRADAPFIAGVGALKGQKVATIRGGKLYDLIVGQYPSIEKYPVDSILDALHAVSDGRADALISGVLLTSYLIQKHHLGNLKIAGLADYPSEELMFAVRRELPELPGILNSAIASITKQEHEAILQKWFRIKVEYRPNWSSILKWLLIIGAFFICVLGVSLYWNRRLALEVTARKQTEKALMEKAAQFHDMFENHHAVMYLIDPGDGKIIQANRAAERFYGHSQETLQRMTIYQINQLDDAEIAARMAHARGRQANRFVFPHKVAGGDVRDVEVHSSPIPFQGKTILFSIVHDVTARRRAEEALRRSEARYRTLIETLPHGVEEIDLNGKMRFCNLSSHRILGFAPNELIGNHIWDRLPEGREKLKAYFAWLVKEQPPPTVYTAKNLTKDGRLIDVRVDWNYQRDADGRLVGFVSVVTDVTEQKEAERRLKAYSESLEEMVAARTRDLEKAQAELLVRERLAVLGHFSGSISHELRNPLAAIDTSAYFLNMKLGDQDEQVQKHLGRIQNNIRKSTDIIESLLNLSRMEKPRAEKHNLNGILSGALESGVAPATVTVIQQFPDGGAFVDADPEQLRMAFNNIIGNAVQAMDGTGTLTVAVRPCGAGFPACHESQAGMPAPQLQQTGMSAPQADTVEISFTDTGPGISEEHIGKVFEPLFTTKIHGIGFGLSITKMIIDNHGGTIRAESPPGSGARFVISLPASASEQTSDGVKEASP